MKLATITASFVMIPGVLLLATITMTITAAGDDHYLLSCGASATVNNQVSSLDQRTWETDNKPDFSTSFASTAAFTTNIPQVPFATARVFNTNFTYSFPVSPGPKFIRLFFYPSPFPYASSSTSNPTFSPADAYLTVQANSHYVLLRNFSAYLSFNHSHEPYGYKEFYVNVNTSVLQLTFSPTHPGSLAFVNGIEVASVPNSLYVGPTPPKNVANPTVEFDISPTASLQNAYRLIVGGNELGPMEDDSSMYRSWKSDDNYLINGFQGLTGFCPNASMITYAAGIPDYSAPKAVYQTFREMGNLTDEQKMEVNNVSWGFEVDLGFRYLVRMHWCEATVDINRSNARVFDVYMDGETAEDQADIFDWAGGNFKAYYKDYGVSMQREEGSGNTGFLQLALHPDTGTRHVFLDVLLNGLEIFKISNEDGSLDAPNPSGELPFGPIPVPSPRQQGSHSKIVAVIIAAVISGAILIGALLCFLLIYRGKKWSKTSAASSGAGSTKSKGLFFIFRLRKTTTTSKSGFNIPAHLSHRFTLAQIRLATNDFSEGLIIGHGGFGNVYKGMLDGEKGPFPVAIKRSNPSSKQGVREFLTEIALLSQFRHIHLVSLIGYCDVSGEMILVYEYMERGTLRDHLYDTDSPPLSWNQRLNACIGAAKGLHYLHAGESHKIIHRDVKSSNILLDKDWVSKVSDFGISKLGPMEDLSHVSTAVKGSFGYLDPEYFRCQRLTEKSDVYSFGVVLFEVLCGRAALDPIMIKEDRNLALWAQNYGKKGELDAIVDPCIKGEIAPACLIKFGEIAGSCVRKHGTKRPSMTDVVMGLELTLELQQHGSMMLDALQFHPPTTDLSVSTSEGVDIITNESDAC